LHLAAFLADKSLDVALVKKKKGRLPFDVKRPQRSNKRIP
jgi:hypothetical protein